MQKSILKGFVFLLVNFFAVLIHLAIFKSLYPFAAWGTAIVHIGVLIMFPYRKFFAGNQKSSGNVSIMFILVAATCFFASCNRVQPNYEGILMSNYGRDGKNDFRPVTGNQGILGPGSELYQVPMFEQKANPPAVDIQTRNSGIFTVDPTYTYQAIRGRGVDIIFNYKHVGINDVEKIMDNIEGAVLDALVLNAYREEARNYLTDSLMSNMGAFEQIVQARLKKEFEQRGFELKELTSGLLPPKSMRDAIEKMNNAKIEAETLKNQLEGERMKLEKAKIEQQANKVRAEGLDSRVLQEQWIEAIRNSKNKVIITDGRTPIILGNQ